MSMLVSLIDWLLKVQTRKVKKSSNPYKNLSVHQFFSYQFKSNCLPQGKILVF